MPLNNSIALFLQPIPTNGLPPKLQLSRGERREGPALGRSSTDYRCSSTQSQLSQFSLQEAGFEYRAVHDLPTGERWKQKQRLRHWKPMAHGRQSMWNRPKMQSEQCRAIGFQAFVWSNRFQAFVSWNTIDNLWRSFIIELFPERPRKNCSYFIFVGGRSMWSRSVRSYARRRACLHPLLLRSACKELPWPPWHARMLAKFECWYVIYTYNLQFNVTNVKWHFVSFNSMACNAECRCHSLELSLSYY